MMKFRASVFAALVCFAHSCIRRCGRLKAHARIARVVFAWLCIATAASAANDSWKGTTSADWNVTTNWSTGIVPVNGDIVLFDNLSTANLSTNNDLSGLSLAGIVNTSEAAPGTAGPSGAVSIGGNALTVGATGILMGGGLTVGFLRPAKVDMAINTDLTLSANQFWQAGGVGPTLTIGASAANTVTLNGFTPTIKNISQTLSKMVINSSLVDGSGPSSVTFDRAGTVTINQRMRLRLNGNSTYSGGTTINEHKQNIQIGSSSTGTSGPFGTGTITLAPGSAAMYFQPVDADRTISNNITLNNSFTAATWLGDTKYKLTLTGLITVPLTQVIAGDNGDTGATPASDGSGELIIDGDVLVGTSGGAQTLTTGAVGNSSPNKASGRVTYNGDILQVAGATVTLAVSNGSTAFPALVQLNGQNTFTNSTLGAAGASAASTDPLNPNGNLQIGSSSVLDINGDIVSGPLGIGTLSLTNNGTAPRIEAVIGLQTVANNIFLGSATVGTAGGIVQGFQELTLSGVISGVNNLSKTGPSKLTMTRDNSWSGNLTVINGTLSVPSIAAAGNQPLGTATTAITLGGTTGSPAVAVAGTLEYTGSAATTLGRQITIATTGTGGTIRATTASGTGLTLNGDGTTSVSAGGKPVTFDGGVSGGNITVPNAITGAGGSVIKTGGGTLTLSGANTYTGDTKNLGGTLNLDTNTPNLADGADVYLTAGSTFGLNFALAGDTDAIRSLYFDNVLQAAGTWGAPGSLASNTSSLFSGIGWLNAAVGAVAGLAGDFNSDTKVNAADYALWRRNDGTLNPLANDNGLGVPITSAHYDLWRANFGNGGPGSGSSLGAAAAVPEPASLLLLLLAGGSVVMGTDLGGGRRRRRND